MSQSHRLASEYHRLMKAGERFARAAPSIAASLMSFRQAQNNFVSLLRSPEMEAVFGHAYGGITDLEGHEDAASFLGEFLEGDALEKEIDLTCFHGLKRSEVKRLIDECKFNPNRSALPAGGITANFIIDQVNQRCDEFVVIVSTSRTLERRRKDKRKAAAIKILQVSSFGALCAVINIPLAIPTIGITATISLGITASAAVLAAQYSRDMEDDQ